MAPLLPRIAASSYWLRNLLAFAVLFAFPLESFAESNKLQGISIGSFAVNQNGAATYSIPIITPPSFGPTA